MKIIHGETEGKRERQIVFGGKCVVNSQEEKEVKIIQVLNLANDNFKATIIALYLYSKY